MKNEQELKKESPFLDRYFATSLLQKGGVESDLAANALAQLMQGARVGHLCMYEKQLGADLASLPSSIVQEGKDLFMTAPVIKHGDRYYLQKNWVYETYILQQISRLRSRRAPSYIDPNGIETRLSQLANQLLPAQLEAIRSTLNGSITFICGGPGTGKTFTAAHLVKCLFSALKKGEREDFYVAVAAPTGKASSHLYTTLQAHGCSDPTLHIQSSTLHRLLKLQPSQDRLFFSGAKIDADLIIVDEASMIDVPLMAHLLEAIGENSILVLIGDPNQLPPVDSGSLFAEISSLYGVHLQRSMRTDSRELQALADAVKEGNHEAFAGLVRLDNPPFSLEEWIRKIDPILSSSPPDPKKSLEKYQSFRILNAIRQGPEGADRLNEEILEALQKTGKWWAAPILATVNDPFHEIYNGMSGILIGYGFERPTVYFPDAGSKAMRHFANLPPFELAFCISVHKSQGSEFDEVHALFPSGSEHFGRESLYTSITRAKKKITIHGEEGVIRKMIHSSSRIQSGFSLRAL